MRAKLCLCASRVLSSLDVRTHGTTSHVNHRVQAAAHLPSSHRTLHAGCAPFFTTATTLSTVPTPCPGGPSKRYARARARAQRARARTGAPPADAGRPLHVPHPVHEPADHPHAHTRRRPLVPAAPSQQLGARSRVRPRGHGRHFRDNGSARTKLTKSLNVPRERDRKFGHVSSARVKRTC